MAPTLRDRLMKKDVMIIPIKAIRIVKNIMGAEQYIIKHIV